MEIIENNGAILGNNRSILGKILNRIIGRKNRIIGTALLQDQQISPARNDASTAEIVMTAEYGCRESSRQNDTGAKRRR